MRCRPTRFLSGIAATAVSLVVLQAASAQNPTSPEERDAAWAAHRALAAESPFAKLPWRALGPLSEGARIEAIAVPSGSRNTIYAAPGAGNVWKTTNNGLTWTPIFDHESGDASEVTDVRGDTTTAPASRAMRRSYFLTLIFCFWSDS